MSLPEKNLPNRAWAVHLEETLSELKSKSLHRTPGGGIAQAVGIDFGSNDYLGLSRSQRVRDAFAASDKAGSAASPILLGYQNAHRQLEHRLAEFHHCEAALVFSSGFACNVGAISCLAGRGDLILSDELNHASLIDGCRLSRATVQVFPHNDTEFVRKYLHARRNDFAKVLLVTESVFSMDGDHAPLAELVDVCEQYECGMAVDEAHATGVYGRHGGGLLDELQLSDRVLLKLGTLSKAVGVVGGYAAGPRLLIDYLVNRCRSYIYSTAMPAAVATAACAAIGELAGCDAGRRRVRDMSQEIRKSLSQQGWATTAGDSPVVPVIVGTETRCLAIAARLMERNIYVPAIRPPTVPAGTARLRISLSASHSDEDIQALLAALADCRE